MYEAITHPFVVKIWIEETSEEAGQVTWRGHITHIPSGKQHYISSLDDIGVFISVYLKEMGVKPGICWRLKQWLKY
ncbi:MAG: hypothetical protein H6657_15000 [Ardenticatenaceae bacterium]|nr:hypothetical protein [Ardenticatenaceae bacterium]